MKQSSIKIFQEREFHLARNKILVQNRSLVVIKNVFWVVTVGMKFYMRK